MPDTYKTGYSNTGAFFSGLGGSILENMAKQKADEEERGRKQKGQALELLGGLMDQVQPESRPLLLQSMADLIGLKGKQRSFWDELTGRNKQDMEALVGGKLQEVLGNVVGPQEYERLKHVDKGLTPANGEPFQIRRPIWEDQSQGKIALRDPQTERLGLEEAKTRLNIGEASAKLQEREAALLERQEYLKRLGADLQGQRDQEQAMLRAGDEVRKRAVTLAGGRIPDSSHYEAAAQQIATQQGLNLDLLRERIGLTGALAGRARAETAYLQSGAKGGAMAGLKPYQRVQTDIKLQNDAQQVFNAYSKAQGEIKAADQQIQQLQQQIAGQAQAMGMKFDPGSGTVLESNGQPSLMGQMMFMKSLGQLQELQGAKTRAQQELGSQGDTLQSKYGEFYEMTKEGTMQPRRGFGGVGTAGASRVPPASQIIGGGRGKAGVKRPMRPQRQGPTAQQRQGMEFSNLQVGQAGRMTSSNVYELGQTLDVGGMQFRVSGVIEDRGVDKVYQIDRIR